MKKGKTGHLILILSLFAIVAACGIVVAYMFKQTDYKDNQFTPANVSCEVHEVTDADTAGNPSIVTEKTSIKVKNTGNINAYLRVRFVSYWVRNPDNGTTEEDDTTEIVAKASQMPEFEFAEGWIKGSNDTYYYQKPVRPADPDNQDSSDNMTEELLASGSTIVLVEEDGYQQVIEVFAEAIQSQPSNAVINSWKVGLDGEGNIITVP